MDLLHNFNPAISNKVIYHSLLEKREMLMENTLLQTHTISEKFGMKGHPRHDHPTTLYSEIPPICYSHVVIKRYVNYTLISEKI
jgi:hypothetical protein